MYISTEPVFQGGIIALTVNPVNLFGVNLTLVVNHYNGKKGLNLGSHKFFLINIRFVIYGAYR